MMTNGNNDTNAADDDVKNKSGLVFQCFSGADFFFFFCGCLPIFKTSSNEYVT